MAGYTFKKRDGEQVYFDFNEDEMYIKEYLASGQNKEYQFRYKDINNYSIVPHKKGYYTIGFSSPDNKIEEREHGEKRYISLVTIKIKQENITKPSPALLSDADDIYDIRSVIYHNTPFRSELDFIIAQDTKSKEKGSSIYEKYMSMSKKEMPSLIVFLLLLALLFLLGCKLLIYDGLIGVHVYNENDVKIKYHRFVNIVTVENNTDDLIYFYYQYGYAHNDSSYDIRDYKRSDVWEVETGEKFIKYVGSYDGYIFMFADGEDFSDVASFYKADWFQF